MVSQSLLQWFYTGLMSCLNLVPKGWFCTSANCNFCQGVPGGIIYVLILYHLLVFSQSMGNQSSYLQAPLFTWLTWRRDDHERLALQPFCLWQWGYLFTAQVTSCLCDTFLVCNWSLKLSLMSFQRLPGERVVGSMGFNFEFHAKHVRNQCWEGLEEGDATEVSIA